jgi:hypothetical protein
MKVERERELGGWVGVLTGCAAADYPDLLNRRMYVGKRVNCDKGSGILGELVLMCGLWTDFTISV